MTRRPRAQGRKLTKSGGGAGDKRGRDSRGQPGGRLKLSGTKIRGPGDGRVWGDGKKDGKCQGILKVGKGCDL